MWVRESKASSRGRKGRKPKTTFSEIIEILNRNSQNSGHHDHHNSGSNTSSDGDTVVGEETSRSRGNKWRKLEIPLFSGEDAYGWVNKIERYLI